MKAAAGPYSNIRRLRSSAAALSGWRDTFGAAGAIAVVYFLAAQLGLALLSQPSGVAVFWPASGFAAGILIASDRRAYAPGA